MENKQGKNAQNLKLENRGVLFRYLATHRQTSRTELTQISGLNKMTVSNIISEFITKRYVVEDSGFASRNNPISLHLSPDAPKVIGLLIHRNRVAAALCNFNLDMLALETEYISGYTLKSLLEAAQRVTDRMMRFGNILGIGIGSIGPVDIHEGVILNPPNFCGIHDVNIVKHFKSLYHLPVFLEYHYNCEALAELYYGNGSKYHDYLFLGVNEGLGLGVVVNNQLLSSFTGYESEFGYLCVNFDDMTARSGVPSGFLGAYVSLDNADEQEIQSGVSTLSFALAGLCNILNPQAIIVGDTEHVLSDANLIAMEQQINERLVARNYRHVDVCKSYRTDNFETSSCAISVIHRAFSGQLLFDSETE